MRNFGFSLGSLFYSSAHKVAKNSLDNKRERKETDVRQESKAK